MKKIKTIAFVLCVILGTGIMQAHAVEQKIAAGENHTIALKGNGTLWAWGWNKYGQLGNGTTANTFILPAMIGLAPDWTAIAAGGNHAIALNEEGALWAWGWNSYGQVGNNSTVNQLIPTMISSAAWTHVAEGYAHSIAIMADGTLWTWGLNDHGQLGNDTELDVDAPVKIGMDSNWADGSGGLYHTLALKTNGTLWSWGYNGFGQLGYDTGGLNQLTPLQIGTATDWSAVSAAGGLSMALKKDRTLWGWGENNSGQLGNNSTVDQGTPLKIGTDTDWTAVSTGGEHSVALKANGTLWAWGDNAYGQLGDGTQTDRHTPVQIGAATDWIAVSAGRYHTVALKENGTLWAWGDNAYGQLGDGTKSGRLTPVRIEGFPKIFPWPMFLPALTTGNP